MLLARRRDGSPLAVSDEADRHAVHDGELSMEELCRRDDLVLDLTAIRYVAHWVTPIGEGPRRFDTRFFLAAAPDGPGGRPRRRRAGAQHVGRPARRHRPGRGGRADDDAADDRQPALRRRLRRRRRRAGRGRRRRHAAAHPAQAAPRRPTAAARSPSPATPTTTTSTDAIRVLGASRVPDVRRCRAVVTPSTVADDCETVSGWSDGAATATSAERRPRRRRAGGPSSRPCRGRRRARAWGTSASRRAAMARNACGRRRRRRRSATGTPGVAAGRHGRLQRAPDRAAARRSRRPAPAPPPAPNSG